MVWLPDSEKNLKLCLFVLAECANVTGTHTRWTHGQTPHDGISRACIASRGKNTAMIALQDMIDCVLPI